MRKSISGFVMGLIGSIFLLGWGTCIAACNSMLESAADVLGGTVSSFYTISGWLCLFGAIAGIVGCSLCFNKARIGGIIMAVATVMTSVFVVKFTIDALNAAEALGSYVLIVVAFQVIPFILLVTGAVLALLAKPKAVAVPNTNQ